MYRRTGVRGNANCSAHQKSLGAKRGGGCTICHVYVEGVHYGA